jgi:rhodanese-related sulfurtransferase
MKQIQVTQLAQWAQEMKAAQPERVPIVLDVREHTELQVASLAQSAHQLDFVQLVHIPMQQVPQATSQWDESQPIACLCHHGVRSMHVALFLEQQGLTQVVNIQGGIHAWSTQMDARVPIY